MVFVQFNLNVLLEKIIPNSLVPNNKMWNILLGIYHFLNVYLIILFRHLFDKIDQSTLKGSNPVDAFRFKTWHRMQDIDSQQVRYSEQLDYILPLSLPNHVKIDEVIFKEYFL